jgi:hypothetical protein
MNKEFYKSKTIWTAAITFAIAIITSGFGITIPAEVYAMLGAAGLYSLRVAK